MSLSRSFVAAGAATLIFSVSAQAADMPGYPRLPPPASIRPLQVDEFLSGWYLRGDLGYRFQRLGSASSDIAPDPIDNKIGNTIFGGFGGGFKEKWFRADLTADYGWRSDYSGTVGATGDQAKIDSYTVLGNIYFDLGTWGGLTPYVGAGAGSAYLTMSNFTTSPAGSVIASRSRWNFAWAAMAGVSYRLSENWLIDVGYRHIDMGDATGGPEANSLTLKKLTGDEIRVGLRYKID